MIFADKEDTPIMTDKEAYPGRNVFAEREDS